MCFFFCVQQVHVVFIYAGLKVLLNLMKLQNMSRIISKMFFCSVLFECMTNKVLIRLVGGGGSSGNCFHSESVIKAFISDTGEALNFVNTNLVVL